LTHSGSGADVPVSALDVSFGPQILELFQNLRLDFSLTYLLISHILPVVAQLATRIAVMQGGRIVETGPAEQVLHAPAHPLHAIADRRHPDASCWWELIFFGDARPGLSLKSGCCLSFRSMCLTPSELFPSAP